MRSSTIISLGFNLFSPLSSRFWSNLKDIGLGGDVLFLSINSEYSSDDLIQFMLFSILACKSWHLGLEVLVHLKEILEIFNNYAYVSHLLYLTCTNPAGPSSTCPYCPHEWPVDVPEDLAAKSSSCLFQTQQLHTTRGCTHYEHCASSCMPSDIYL